MHQSTLFKAIREHRIILLKYHDDVLNRDVEPYAVFDSTTGKTLLFGIQLRNSKKPLDPREPRYFELRNIRSVQITDKKFVPDHGFSAYKLKACLRVLASV